MPEEIVATFGKHGFIWVGHHFDTMHFAVRPELLVVSGHGSERRAPLISKVLCMNYQNRGHMKKMQATAVISLMVVFLSSAAYSRSYRYGDQSYRLDWGTEPQIETACWRWNWQLHHWNNYCPAYVQPKAFMYPRSRHVLLRTRG